MEEELIGEKLVEEELVEEELVEEELVGEELIEEELVEEEFVGEELILFDEEVVEVGDVELPGKDSGEKETKKMKASKFVFCHLEFLRSSSSPDLHLTQLAAVSPDNHLPIFLPVVPPVLAQYLDNYKLGGDLMQALTMTRDLEDKNTFLFRPTVLVEEVRRVVCVPEQEALRSFLNFFDGLGRNIILVVILNFYICGTLPHSHA